MFGYIIVNKQELKFREFDVYQSYYCGLCQSLKERFGRRGQLTLSYDMTFVALLLSALYDEPVESSTCKCVAHPFEAHATSRSVFTDYAADMNLLLSYYKCLDDWTDERKWKGRLRAAALRGRDKMVEARYPEKAEHIYTLLEHIHLYEKAQEPDVDLASGCFGEIMGEILACRKDEWEDDLRRMGFFLGKFIYLMDAYDDVEKECGHHREQHLGAFLTQIFSEEIHQAADGDFPEILAASRYHFQFSHGQSRYDDQKNHDHPGVGHVRFA